MQTIFQVIIVVGQACVCASHCGMC